ncbi:MAG: dihydropteroate synthase [Deltaproteobacteria bacterium]|nr:dihydropteroate synthase [Deltaproteobacteria bacterium]
MGIVNRTPDSFSDGGRFVEDGAARSHVAALVRAGADVVDLGAESTRPGAPAVAPATQIVRLGALVGYAVSLGVTVSVDTTSPEVAAFALAEGARMINSVALAPARDLARLAARHGADLILTHCRGSMTEMAGFSRYPDDAYGDVVEDVAREWRCAAEEALSMGLPPERLWFDPGLGFTKNAAQSLELCARLDELKARVEHPILVGASRKSFVAHAIANGDAEGPEDRLGGSLAAALDCARRGADMLRVHDVRETVQALAYLRAVARHERARVTPSATTSSDATREATCSTA